MPAGRDTGVLEEFQAQRAPALLTWRDPGHSIRVLAQVVPRHRRGEVREGRRILNRRDNRIISSLSRLQKLGLQLRVFLLLLQASGDLPDVRDTLHGDLQDEQNTQDFVADTLLILLKLLGEHVTEVPESLGKVVIRAGEVERRNAKSVNRRERGYRVQVLEDVLLNLQLCD